MSGQSPAILLFAGRLLRAVALLPVGFGAYLWSGLSVTALMRFGQADGPSGLLPVPFDYRATLVTCIGPVGWIAGLGVFGFGLVMAGLVYRCRWPVRVLVAAAPLAVLMYLIACTGDIYPWVRAVALRIAAAQGLLAVLAAVVCRPAWQVLLAVWRSGPAPTLSWR